MHFLSSEAKSILLGAPTDQRMAMQSLERPSIRAAIEEILTKFAGHRLLVKFEVREDLQSHELATEGDHDQTNDAPAISTFVVAPSGEVVDEGEFQNDPLIKEALRIFEAKITKKG